VRGLVLMYHDVHEGAAPAAGMPRTASLYHVSRAAFREHLRVVAARGIPVRTVGEYVAGAGGDSIVLTFDDGWEGSLSAGAECLVEAGLRATFFVTRDHCGRPGFAGASLLRDAHAAGMEVGAHGATHRLLARLSEAELRAELESSKAFLEDLLGAPVTTASVPGGDWSPLVARVAREAGYTALCTSRPGVNDGRTDPLALRRVAIRRSTTLAAVERYADFRVGGAVLRAAAFDLPRRLVGPRRYAALRARLLGS
jgi:peptidoglycan/xylan/chitin deacetylase (PgdA/CDA1 family)